MDDGIVTAVRGASGRRASRRCASTSVASAGARGGTAAASPRSTTCAPRSTGSRRAAPGARLALAGYSFGAAVAVRAARRGHTRPSASRPSLCRRRCSTPGSSPSAARRRSSSTATAISSRRRAARGAARALLRADGGGAHPRRGPLPLPRRRPHRRERRALRDRRLSAQRSRQRKPTSRSRQADAGSEPMLRVPSQARTTVTSPRRTRDERRRPEQQPEGIAPAPRGPKRACPPAAVHVTLAAGRLARSRPRPTRPGPRARRASRASTPSDGGGPNRIPRTMTTGPERPGRTTARVTRSVPAAGGHTPPGHSHSSTTIVWHASYDDGGRRARLERRAVDHVGAGGGGQDQRRRERVVAEADRRAGLDAGAVAVTRRPVPHVRRSASP